MDNKRSYENKDESKCKVTRFYHRNDKNYEKENKDSKVGKIKESF